MKKIIAVFAIAAALLAAGGCALQPQEAKITICGVQYPLTLTELDLSGAAPTPEELAQLGQLTQLETLDLRGTCLTTEAFEQLQKALPACKILWEPPFQGRFYPQDTTVLTTDSLTEADLAQLDYFPQLTTLDATGCTDYALLRQLQADHPALALRYSIYLNSAAYPQDTSQLTLESPDAADFEQLAHFPLLEQVFITGTLPETEVLSSLAAQYPDIAFSWEVELLGSRYPWDTAELDLSGTPLTGTGAIEAALPWFPLLEKVDLRDCGLGTDILGPFQEQHPDIKFVWWMDLGAGNRIRTDATAFVAEPFGVKLYDDKLAQLKYCTEMVCLDLGHMPITDCSFVAHMPKLQYLILAISSISDITPLAGLEELVFLELFKTNVVDYTPLLTCPALEDLNICGSTGGGAWETLMEMTWLKRLYLGWDGTSNKTAQTIAQALPDTQVVLDPAGGSTGGGWRQGQRYYEMRDLLGKDYMEQ